MRGIIRHEPERARPRWETNTMQTFLRAVALSMSVASAPAAQAEPPKDPEVGLAHLALTNAPAKGDAKLTVTTPAFKQMGDIPFENTQYQGSKFPGLEWSAGT